MVVSQLFSFFLSVFSVFRAFTASPVRTIEGLSVPQFFMKTHATCRTATHYEPGLFGSWNLLLFGEEVSASYIHAKFGLTFDKVYWVCFYGDFSPVKEDSRMDFKKAVHVDRMVGIKELTGE